MLLYEVGNCQEEEDEDEHLHCGIELNHLNSLRQERLKEKVSRERMIYYPVPFTVLMLT